MSTNGEIDDITQDGHDFFTGLLDIINTYEPTIHQNFDIVEELSKKLNNANAKINQQEELLNNLLNSIKVHRHNINDISELPSFLKELQSEIDEQKNKLLESEESNKFYQSKFDNEFAKINSFIKSIMQ